MNVANTRPIDLQGLKSYKAANPVKFKHKFGDLDLDSVPANFNIFLYKNKVTAERVRRTVNELDQDSPAITPELFAPKVVEPKPEVPDTKVSDMEAEIARLKGELAKKDEVSKPAVNETTTGGLVKASTSVGKSEGKGIANK